MGKFTKDITAMAKLYIYMNHMYAVSLANRLRAVADAFCPMRTH